MKEVDTSMYKSRQEFITVLHPFGDFLHCIAFYSVHFSLVDSPRPLSPIQSQRIMRKEY